MLIAFLGAPQSGKTTIALGLSYHLKLLGHAVEYLPEFVRHHFTELRHKNLPLSEMLPQSEIYKTERSRQKMYKETLTDSIVISDVVCNTGELYGLEVDAAQVAEDLKMYDVIFFCPLPQDVHMKSLQKDVNRIHGLHELNRIQKDAYALVKKYDLIGKVHVLDHQTAPQRVAHAVDTVMERFESARSVELAVSAANSA